MSKSCDKCGKSIELDVDAIVGGVEVADSIWGRTLLCLCCLKQLAVISEWVAGVQREKATSINLLNVVKEHALWEK